MGQPAGIAVLASLGIHGAIALILPLVPVNTSKSEKQDTTPKAVGITTLTPQEQARLPQTAIANPQQAKATPMQPQTGVASQLPPMPDFAAANATAASPLPPLPAFPGNSQPLPPLPNATSVNVPTFPRGQRVATGGFNIDTGFRANPLPRRNYPAMVGNPRIGDVVGSQISAGRPVSVANIPGEFNPGSPRVADPPLSSPLPEGVPEGMAPQNGNRNPVVVNNDAREFVTPTGEPLQAGGEFSIANQQIPGVTPLPDNSLTQKIATVLENNQNQHQHSTTVNTGDSSDGNGGNTRVSKALLMAQHYQQAQKNHGQLQTKQPLNLTLDRDGLKDVVDVGLVVKADGTIDDFKVFTNDGKQLSFEQSNAIRQFLADYLRKNPPANTGKPIYLTANIAPGNTAEKPAANANEVTIPTKPLTVNNGNNNINNGNQTEQKPVRSLEVIRPNTNNPSPNPDSATERKPVGSSEVIRSNTNNPNAVEVAPVQPITPTTTKPQLEAEPSFSEPVRLRTPRPVTIPTQQPSRNPLLETTPRSINQINQPSGESPKPTRIQSWRERLTPQKDNADDDRNENSNQSRGIQKLRELAEIKNQSNP